MVAERSPPTVDPTPARLPARLLERLMALAAWLEAVNEQVGRAVAWLALAMVLVTFLVVVLRYAFDTGAIALQESVTYLHATLFMLGIGYTLRHDGHVRVDIFYQRFSRRGRAWVDLLGTLLLLVPVCVFLLWSSFGYVADAWAIREGSREAGGIPGVWLLKTLILALPVLVLVQGLAWLLRNGLFLLGVTAALPVPGAAPGPAPDLTKATDDEARHG